MTETDPLLRCCHRDCGTADAPHGLTWKCEAGHRVTIRYCTPHIAAAISRALAALEADNAPGCAICPEWKPMRPLIEWSHSRAPLFLMSQSPRQEDTVTATTETKTPPPPTFPYEAYGVNLTLIGDEGAMMAEGHVPLVRFAAACNRMARTKLQCRNLMDWSEATLQDALDGARHCWALPAEDPDGDDCDWYVRYDPAVTAETPGALPVTLWEP